VKAGLLEGRLPSVYRVSKSQRGSGRPCVVCAQSIEPTHVEREVFLGFALQAHPWMSPPGWEGVTASSPRHR
jgi:hypothetical protein